MNGLQSKSDESLRETRDTLMDTIRECRKDKDADGVRNLCKASAALAQVEGQIRAREKAAAKDAERMTPAIVMGWIEKQPDNVKQHLIKLIHLTMRSGDSVLG